MKNFCERFAQYLACGKIEKVVYDGMELPLAVVRFRDHPNSDIIAFDIEMTFKGGDPFGVWLFYQKKDVYRKHLAIEFPGGITLRLITLHCTTSLAPSKKMSIGMSENFYVCTFSGNSKEACRQLDDLGQLVSESLCVQVKCENKRRLPMDLTQRQYSEEYGETAADFYNPPKCECGAWMEVSAGEKESTFSVFSRTVF